MGVLITQYREGRSRCEPIVYQIYLAAGLGIEPKFSLSESDVLPLDDPAIVYKVP